MPSPTQITPAQLVRLIGTPGAPVLIDVRIDEDFNADPRLVAGSRRFPHTDMASILSNAQGRRAVVLCEKGKKLSQGVAAMLRAGGVAAETVEGGVAACREHDTPMVPEARIPARDAAGRTVWVTRQRPKIDRIACPWLIRRFIDPTAQFLYVEPEEVPAVAERFAATPFDIEGAFWSHRGELCTFDVMVEEFGLASQAMLRLATIVRGADTDRHELAPQSAGLLAASLGLSRIHRDDLAQLEAGMGLYDAFYRWARDAHMEGHDWPADRGRA